MIHPPNAISKYAPDTGECGVNEHGVRVVEKRPRVLTIYSHW